MARRLLSAALNCCAILMIAFAQAPIACAQAESGEETTAHTSGGLAIVAPTTSTAIETSAAESSTAVPACHALWVVSTRHLSGNCLYLGAVPRVARYEGCAGWRTSSVEEFQATDQADVVTIVFVHGNRITAEAAIKQGMSAYGQLVNSACPSRPLRFVIWSWPSDGVPGTLLNDADFKAGRCEIKSHYEAQFLARIGPEVPLTVIGFSFGSRVTSAALHLAGGGAVAGHVLAEPLPVPRTAPTRALLLAAAIDCDWLAPGHRYGLALSQIDRLMLTVNPRDIVLKHYPRLARRAGIEAVGLVGVGGGLGSEAIKVQQFNVSEAIGCRHAWFNYLKDSSTMALIRREALFLQ